MLLHTLRLIWNRKRDNSLIILELVLAFLVVFFAAAFSFHSWDLYRQPLGFEWRDTVEVRFSTGGEWTEQDGKTLSQLMQALRNEPSVEWTHAVYMPIFRNSRWQTDVLHEGIKVRTRVNQMSDGAPEDFGVELLDGRWYNAGDAASEEEVVLINERLRDQLFGGANPIGADIRDREDPEDQGKPPWRIIGVFRDFRQTGELQELTNYVIGRVRLEELTEQVYSVAVRLRPDTPVSVEERLQHVAQSVAPQWRILITPVHKLRDRQIKEVVIPLTVGGFITAFLLLMVAFGMFGVLWQNVTRRTDELGLRRAVGATRRRIYRQIVLETAVLAGLGVGVGSVIVIQFPLTAAFDPLTWKSSSIGILAAGGTIVALAAMCSLYPAWMAARRSVAEALHYE